MDHRRAGGLMTHGVSDSAFTSRLGFSLFDTNNAPAPSLMISQITPRTVSERVLAPKLTTLSSSSSRFKLDTALSPLMESLEFGFLPKPLVVALQDKDWKVRSDSIDQFLDIAIKLDDTVAIIPHLPLLIKLLTKLLNDSNFTICLTTIRIIGDLFPKLQISIKPHLRSFLPNLIEKFGDSKIIIRQETLKVVTKLMHMVSPTPVLEIILESCSTKHWHIKQHTLFVVIKALLTFKDHRFDYGMIVTAMVPLLEDTKPKVKQTATEVLAVVYSTLGTQLDPMLGNLSQEHIKMLHRRFSKGQLPIVCPDGSVELQLRDTEEDCEDRNIATPSMPSTPLTHSVGSNDEPEVQLRPVRHWSAGAKITTRTKLPPWFPSTPTPGTPVLGEDFANSPTDPRKGISRTRSYSVSAQQERVLYTPTNLPPLSPQHAPPSPMGFPSQTPSRSMSPSISPLHSPTAFDNPTTPTPFFSPAHHAPNSPVVEGEHFFKRNNLPLDQGGRYSPSLGKIRGASSYYPPVFPVTKSTDEEDEDVQSGLVRRSSGSLSPSGGFSVVEKRRSPSVSRRRDAQEIYDSAYLPIVDNSLLENIEDMPLYDLKPAHGRKSSISMLDEADDAAATSEHQPEPNSLAPRHNSIRSRSPLKSSKVRSRALTDPTPAPASPSPSTKQPRVVNTSPSEIIPTDALTPADNPEQELKLALDWFSHGEWYNQFEACCSVRRLAAFHPKIITAQIHDIVSVVLTAANNLRSLVSRHALVCLGDLFKFVGKPMEPHLDEVVVKVIKKYNESNSFIEKELDRAMSLMLENVSESRSLVVLLQVSNHKSATVRAKVACFLGTLLQSIGLRIWEMREIDKVIPIVSQFVQEGSGDARAHGRKALYLLYSSNPSEFEKLLKKLCSDSLQRRVREILEKLKSSGSDSINYGTSSARKPSASSNKTPVRTLRTQSTVSSPAPTQPLNTDVNETAKTTSVYLSPAPQSRYGSATPTQQRTGSNTPTQMTGKDPQEFESLPSIFAGMDSSEWRMRYEAITAMVEMVQKYPARIASKLVRIFDHFTPRLTDSNSKVNGYALQSLKQLIPLLRGALEPSLAILVPPLAANLASSKQDVRTLTVEVFELLAGHIDNTVLIPHFTLAASNHANTKVKVALLQHLADIVGAVYQQKPQVVMKHVLPFAFKLLDERKGEMRTVNGRLLQALYRVMGNSLWDSAVAQGFSKQDQTKLQDLLSL